MFSFMLFAENKVFIKHDLLILLIFYLCDKIHIFNEDLQFIELIIYVIIGGPD